MFKHFFLFILTLLFVLPVLAESPNPGIEIVLSTAQAQRGDRVYADVNIRNGKAVAGADIGISTDDCLRVVERQPGNYLPATGENGGFSAFEELDEHSTRLSVAVTTRVRIASGDGTFFRVAMDVICDDAVAQITVSFAQLAALADPDSNSNNLSGFSIEQGNLRIASTSLNIQPGAIASTAVPIPPLASPGRTESTPPLLFAALGLMFISSMGLLVLFAYYRRQS